MGTRPMASSTPPATTRSAALASHHARDGTASIHERDEGRAASGGVTAPLYGTDMTGVRTEGADEGCGQKVRSEGADGGCGRRVRSQGAGGEGARCEGAE